VVCFSYSLDVSITVEATSGRAAQSNKVTLAVNLASESGGGECEDNWGTGNDEPVNTGSSHSSADSVGMYYKGFNKYL
jgi:hypothetical protein